MKAYPQEFYASMRDKTTYLANTILDIVLQRIPAVHSAVDVGCGVGNWLAVLREKGASEIQGLDGSWVDQDLLAIPRSSFKQVDLSRSAIELPRRYDLAISLEVAEHLPPDRAEEFVTSLTALSDHVLFSAAIPFQGGINHLNEQWQHYWADLFAARGYGVHDFIRPRIWNDSKIPFWYRQNAFLFSNQATADDTPSHDAWSLPLDLVHPRLYQRYAAQAQSSVRGSLRHFHRSLRDYIGGKLGKAG